MKFVFSVLLVSLFIGNAFAADTKPEAINFLVTDLSKYPHWIEGNFISLSLPLDATFNQLTSAYLKQTRFKSGVIRDYGIEETKDCEIPPNSKQVFKIVRISSDQGGKFLIFRYESDHWWSKNYDAKEQYLKTVAEQGEVTSQPISKNSSVEVNPKLIGKPIFKATAEQNAPANP